MSDTPRTDACWDDEGCNILMHARQLERERNQARQERDELREALEIAVEYIAESLADYDSSFNRHPATESVRKAISDDLEKCTSILEKLKENKSGGV